MLNAIFFVTMYPFIFLMYFMFKHEGVVKHRTLFGIHISEQWLSKKEWEAMEQEYKRKINRYLLLFAVIPFATLFIPFFSVNFTIWMLWLLAAIAIFMLPYAMGNEKLKRIKQQRSATEGAHDIIYAELKGAGTIRTIKGIDFLVPNLLSIGIAIFCLFTLHDERFELYSIIIIFFAVCTLLFYGCAIWMDRMKTKVISFDSDVNINYTRATKRLWKQFWGICLWGNTIFTAIIFAIVLLKNFANAMIHIILWGSVVYCLFTIGIGVLTWAKMLKLEQQYADKMDLPDEDNEKAWIGGIIYYNPKDKHTYVSKKFGIGTTCNLATKTGKAMTLIGIIALLIVPISCVWIMMEEFTPISLSIADNTLIAEHWKTDYEVPITIITEVSLLEELPRCSKVSGTGMDNLLKGTFRNSEDGKFQCFLNPQNSMFIRFTAGGTIYYMSGYDDEETLEIYEMIQ